MTLEQFQNLSPDECFVRQRKEYVMVKKDEGSIVGHPKGDTKFLIHFMQPKMPAPYMAAGTAAKRLAVDIDVLTEPRKQRDMIGKPSPGAMQFLIEAHK